MSLRFICFYFPGVYRDLRRFPDWDPSLARIGFFLYFGGFLTNIISYFVVSLIVRQLMNPLPLVLLTAIQSLVCALVYLQANKVYFILYPARQCIVVCAGTEKELSIVKKFGRVKERYKICSVCSETLGYDILVEKIDRYSAVIIGDIDPLLRLRLMTYCFEQSKRLFIVPTMQDIMLNKAHETQIGDSLVYLCKKQDVYNRAACHQTADGYFCFTGGVAHCFPGHAGDGDPDQGA